VNKISLPADPRSASAARRFVRDVLTEWEEREVAELVELLISELVTNAILHAGSAVDVSVQRRSGRLRAEVADGSDKRPVARGHDDTSTTGRGLELIEALATAWGVTPGVAGKVIWFEVHAEHEEPRGLEHTTMPELPGAVESASWVDVRLLDTPAQLFIAMEEHLHSALREYSLTALAQASGRWEAPTLPFNVRGLVDRLLSALETGEAKVDVAVRAPVESLTSVHTVGQALDELDGLAAAGELLIPPALPEVKACRDWFMGEVAAQLSGAAPRAWPGAQAALERRTPSAVEHEFVLQAVGYGVVVADTENRVAYTNAAAEDLLGWPRGALAGQRLTAIIPDRLQDAHIAGYTRYLVRQEPRILGVDIRVPARRYDGSEIEIHLRLHAFHSSTGQLMFVGTLLPADAVLQRASGVQPGDILGPLVQVLAVTPQDMSLTLERRALTLLETLADALGWQVGAWWIPAEDGLHCVATWSDEPGRFDRFTNATLTQTMQHGVGLPGRVWASMEPVW
ncbi:MAG TPA: PAS domain-containing protein, partial [Chloroflexota bacterium]|nr:PAS domain-containing protein [Chloroflexota bacterium]